MKYKSATTLLIASIVLVLCVIIEIFKPYHKIKNIEISKTRWIQGIVLVLYIAFFSGFGSYSFYTGLHSELLNSMFIPLCILGIVLPLKVLFSGNIPDKVSKGGLVYILFINIFLLYIIHEDFYIAIYKPYISIWFN